MHTVEDPKDFVHADTNGKHFALSFCQTMLVDVPDQVILANDR